jgi:hypothetical protein
MGAVMFHVSDRANRESIRQHGLDWRRMGGAMGIAGNRAPECEESSSPRISKIDPERLRNL